MTDQVYYARAVYGDAEIEAVERVLREAPTALMNGEKVAQFERRVAEIFGVNHGVMVNSGSSANLLALASLGLRPGGEVITPALTFATTVAPIVQLGLVPSFVDSERRTFNVDVEQVEEALTPATVAIMVPNLIGNLPDWPKLKDIARRHGVPLIEDSADTLGARQDGEPTGRFADVSTTSFYASHIVTGAGFGGMLVSDDEPVASRARLLRGWGRSSSIRGESESIGSRFDLEVDGVEYDAKFVFAALGYNFLPSELAAAFGLEQLLNLDANIKTRRESFDLLVDGLSKWDEVFELPLERAGAHTAWLAFPIVIRDDPPFTRRQLQIALEERNIQTRVIFSGNILRHPAMKDVDVVVREDGYPEADRVMRNGLLVGCHHGMGPREVETILEAIESYLSST